MLKITFFIIAYAFLAMQIPAKAQEYKIYNTKTGKEISLDEMAEISAKSQAVYFGEFHDDSLIHALQFDFFKKFYQINKNLTLSLEMFERDVQSQLNSYLKNEITDEEFQKNSRPWPDYKKYYRSMVEFAKENSLDVLAANIPRKYAAMYAQSGTTKFSALTPEEKSYIAEKIVLQEDVYLSNFFVTMLGSQEKAKSLTPNQENTILLYYGSQCLKDETMAETIVEYLQKNPDKKLIHINGDFHSNSYLGTTQKVLNRNKSIKTTVIAPLYYDEIKNLKFDDSLKSIADFVIYVPNFAREPQMMRGSHFGENYVAGHNIKIEILPVSSELIGEDKLEFKNPILKSASLKLLNSLEVLSVTAKDADVRYETRKVDDFYNEIVIFNPTFQKQSYSGGGIVEFTELTVKYKGRVNFAPSETNLVKRHSNSPGIISNKTGEGLYLPGGSFYPQSDKDLASFNVEIKIDKDYTIVTSGDVKQTSADNKNIFSVTTTPIDELTLVGGRYSVIKKTHDGKEFAIYTLKDNPNAEKYLDESIKYYDFYVPLFGKYSYNSFSIVENFFATGFGMPGYTLLSDKLTAMPWVLLSPGSLAHEFVHNWWGNSVLVDYNMGNWCEALTTFSTNYYLNVLTGNEAESRSWRQKALLAIDALPAEKNYPVNDFKYQRDTYDAVIGYEKGAFIFQEILKLTGKDLFFATLKSFAEKNTGKRAFWSTLANEFGVKTKDTLAELKLKNLMNEWLKSTDLPDLKISDAVHKNDSLYITITSTLKRTMSVPLEIIYADKSVKQYFILNDSSKTYAVYSPQKPNSVKIDGGMEVLRKLNNHEKPYNFNRTLSNSPLVIMPDKNSKEYEIAVKYLELLKESGYDFKAVAYNEVSEKEFAENSVIILGNPKSNLMMKRVSEKLPAGVSLSDDNFTYPKGTAAMKEHILLVNSEHPFNSDKLCTMIVFDGIADVAPLNRLIHYRSYSLVLLNLSRSGRPAYSQEILPSGGGENSQVWVVK